MKMSLNDFGFVRLGALLALAAFGFLSATPLAAQTPPTGKIISGQSYHHDVSPALRDLPAWSRPEKENEEKSEGPRNPKLPNHHVDKPDAVVQSGHWLSTLAPAIPAPILNFDGIPYPGVGCNCSPPDTVGVVGATQYVQMVNEGYQVFNKSTGASVLGPLSIVSLWSGFGGVCETAGSGDPVVMYDHLANRWVITQFAGTSVPTDECIAVSTTSDATGTYFRYAFHLGSNFFDYPHLAVWPDGYYMSMNVFNTAGTAFLGPQPFAFNRAAMLNGSVATFVTPGITGGPSEDTYLPADLDGSILPPAGTPNTFVAFPGNGTYKTWHFHADFVTPANSTFTLFASPAAAGFTMLCPTTRGCVPQPGTTVRLDGIGDRLMYRLAYRKFSDGHESVVGNFSVSSGGVAGIRWFELRNVSSGPVTVYQESTYQPDTTWRWMGSAAMDADGNLAIGFSAASGTVSPGIRYAGRLATDPLNVLSQGEATLIAGGGSQTSSGNRWGDYSALTIDPVDDRTFWYTNEYYSATASVNWKTRIGSFKMPVTVPAPIIGAGGPPTVIAENFIPANGVPDPGETITVNLPLINTGTANTTNLVGTLQATGGVTNPSGPQTYGVLVAGGAAVSKTFTFTASGSCGSNLTLSLALQDGSTSLGTVTYTVQLGNTTSVTTSFSNATALTIPASGTGTTTGAPAGPYPSNIVVSGMSGTISKVTVNLKSLTHTFPSDVDVLLVGPGGQTFVIASDVIGGTAWSNISYLLDDAAAAVIPSTGTPVSGTFRPTNYGTGDLFPSPAPQVTYNNPATAGAATFASVYNGTNPNGTWSLYVVDDASTDIGTMAGGWTINITSTSSSCVSPQAPNITNGPPSSPVIVGAPYNFAFTATGNPPPTFSVTGTLPPGLGVSTTGVLSGIATSGGTGSYPGISVTAANGILPNASQTFTLMTATRAAEYIAGYGLVGSDAALTYDYDLDGIANLMEYGLLLNPTIANINGLPVVTLKDYGGTRYLSMIFNRSSLATDLTYVVEGSSDLTNWTDLGTSSGGGTTTGPGFVGETGSAPNFAVEVRDTVPADSNPLIKRFLRLKLVSQ